MNAPRRARPRQGSDERLTHGAPPPADRRPDVRRPTPPRSARSETAVPVSHAPLSCDLSALTSRARAPATGTSPDRPGSPGGSPCRRTSRSSPRGRTRAGTSWCRPPSRTPGSIAMAIGASFGGTRGQDRSRARPRTIAAWMRRGLEAARAALLAERDRLLAEVGETIVAPGQMTYGSQAAAASQVFEQQRDLALRDRADQQLVLVDAALARLEEGTFGTCVRCGGPSRPSGSRPCPGRPTASTASAIAPARPPMTVEAASPAGHASTRSAPPPSASAGSRPNAARPLRPAGRAPLPQGRVAPADRRVQDPRRVRRDRLAADPRARRAA